MADNDNNDVGGTVYKNNNLGTLLSYVGEMTNTPLHETVAQLVSISLRDDITARNALMSDIARECEKEMKRNKREQVVIHTRLTKDEERSITDDYPEYELVYTASKFLNHAECNARRIVEEHYVISRAERDSQAIAINGRNYDYKICAVGDNWARNFYSGRHNIHSCNPILSAEDGYREARNMLDFNASHNDENYRKFVNINNGQPMRCSNKSQHCPITAPVITSIHSIYDLSTKDVVDIMLRKNSYAFYSVHYFSPDIIISDWDKDHELAMGMHYRKFILKKRRVIEFWFKHEIEKTYLHSYDDYIDISTRTTFLHKGQVFAYASRRYVGEATIFTSILRLTKTIPAGNLRTKIHWESRVPSVLVTVGVKISDAPIKCRRFGLKQVMVSKDTYKRVRNYVLQKQDANFTVQTVVKAIVSFESAIIINNKTVIPAAGQLDNEYLLPLATAIYLRAYEERYDNTQFLSAVVKDIDKSRRTGFWASVCNLFSGTVVRDTFFGIIEPLMPLFTYAREYNLSVDEVVHVVDLEECVKASAEELLVGDLELDRKFIPDPFTTTSKVITEKLVPYRTTEKASSYCAAHMRHSRIVPNNVDGDCLFHSLAHLLDRRGEVLKMKNEVLESEALATFPDQAVKEQCIHELTNDNYASDPTIAVTAQHFQRTLCIHMVNGTFKIYETFNAVEVLHLHHEDGHVSPIVEHLDNVVPRTGFVPVTDPLLQPLDPYIVSTSNSALFPYDKNLIKTFMSHEAHNIVEVVLSYPSPRHKIVVVDTGDKLLRDLSTLAFARRVAITETPVEGWEVTVPQDMRLPNNFAATMALWADADFVIINNINVDLQFYEPLFALMPVGGVLLVRSSADHVASLQYLNTVFADLTNIRPATTNYMSTKFWFAASQYNPDPQRQFQFDFQNLRNYHLKLLADATTDRPIPHYADIDTYIKHTNLTLPTIIVAGYSRTGELRHDGCNNWRDVMMRNDIPLPPVREQRAEMSYLAGAVPVVVAQEVFHDAPQDEPLVPEPQFSLADEYRAVYNYDAQPPQLVQIPPNTEYIKGALIEYKNMCVTTRAIAKTTALEIHELLSNINHNPELMAGQLRGRFSSVCVFNCNAKVHGDYHKDHFNLLAHVDDGVVTFAQSSENCQGYWYAWRLLEAFHEPILHSRLSVKAVDTYNKYPTFNAVVGVVGSGKTSEIVQMYRKGDLVIACSKAAIAELWDRTTKKCGRLDKNDFRTIYSYLINCTTKYKRVLVDEVYMMHAGLVVALAAVTQCKEIYTFGDPLQIGYINPGPMYEQNYWDYKRIARITKTLSISHRIPQDVCRVVAPYYQNHGIQLTTSSRVRHSIVWRQSNNYNNIGGQVMTLKNMDMTVVKNLHPGTNTVHRCQGMDTDETSYVRIDAKTKDDIYKREEYALVALTRHKKRMTIITPPSVTATDDRIVEWLVRAGITPQMRVAGLYREQEYNFLKTTLTTRQIIQIRKRAGDMHLFKSLGVTHLTEDDYKVLALPSTDEQYIRRQLKSSIPSKAKSDDFTEQYMDVNVLMDGIAYRPVVEPIDCELDHIECETRSVVTLEQLQQIHDTLLPGHSSVDKTMYVEMAEMSDRVFVTGPVTINIDRTVYEPPWYCTMVPNLKTSMELPRPVSFVQVMSAIEKRNCNVELYDSTTCQYQLADAMYDSVMNLCSLGSSFTLPEIYYNYSDLREWAAKTSTCPTKDPDMVNFRLHALNIYEVMIKKNAKPNLEMSALTSIQALQTICYQGAMTNALFCPIFQTMRKRLQALLPSNIVLNVDMSPDDLGAVVTPYLLDYGGNTYEVDISQYDKSQGHGMLLFECRIFSMLGMPEDLVALWYAMHEFTIIRNRPLGLKIAVDFQRKSGDAATFFGNTIVLLGALSMAYNMRSVRMALLAGDDSIIYTDGTLMTDNHYFTHVFGFDVKYLVNQPPYFCSKFVIQSNRSVYVVPDPVKFICKLGRHDLLNPDHVVEYWLSTKDALKNYADQSMLIQLAFSVSQRYRIPCTPQMLADIYTFVSSFATFKTLYDLPDGPMLLDKTPVAEI